MNIYVGNLSYQVSEEELKEEFKNFGDVKSTKIIIDRETGRSKGFGFVEMEQTEEGENAINQLNGKDLKGRNIKVNESRPKN